MALTPKQENFAQLIADGKAYSEAYRLAYNSEGSNETVQVSASTLANSPNVSIRIAELKNELAAKLLWKREDSVKVLREIAKRNLKIDEETGEIIPASKDTDKIAAVKELNAMHGFNAPIKNEHTFPEPRKLKDFYED